MSRDFGDGVFMEGMTLHHLQTNDQREFTLDQLKLKGGSSRYRFELRTISKKQEATINKSHGKAV